MHIISCTSNQNGCLPFALVLIRQFFILAIEPIILGGYLLCVCRHTIDFAISMINNGRWCASQRYFTHWPVRIVIQISWHHSDLQLVIVIEIDDAIRTIDIIEWSETFHCRLLIELVCSQFTFGR